MNIHTDIAQHLHNQGIGVLGTSLFYDYLPDTNSGDFSISVYDTSGLEPDRYIPVDKPTFQVFIRAKDYNTGRAKLAAVYDALNRQKNIQLVPDGTYFYYIFAMSRGGSIGRNDAGWNEFSINFNTMVREDD